MALTDKLSAIGGAIRQKTGKSGMLSLPQMVSEILAIETGIPAERIVYSQVNSKASEYIANVNYDPSDYSSSEISNYVVETTYDKSKPFGATIPISNAGTLSICDGNNSISESVVPGNKVIYNVTPGTTGSYLVISNGEIVSAGLLQPTGSLRMINGGGNTFNIRDLGGWSCDGGKLAYGKLFRGCQLNGAASPAVTLTEDQKTMFRDLLGIRDEIDLRDDSEAYGITASALDDTVNYIRLPVMPYGSGINLDNSQQTQYYASLIKRIAEDVNKGDPCYIHCVIGADRTGTLCALIEGLCGVSRSDIDKDYELTSFSGDNTRLRSGAWWRELMERIESFSGSAFRDKVVDYALKAGVTIAEINTLRNGLIEGNPTPIISPYQPVSVSYSLTGITEDHHVQSTERYQPFEVSLLPDDGKIISELSVQMGGEDITDQVFTGTRTVFRHSVTASLVNCTLNNKKISVIDGEGYAAVLSADAGYTIDSVLITAGGIDMSNYYSDGKIVIPKVTGDITITATARQSAPAYTNLVDPATWSTGYRLNSSGKLTVQSGVSVSNFIPATAGDVIRVKNFDYTQAHANMSYIAGYSAEDEASFLYEAGVNSQCTSTDSSSNHSYLAVESLADGTLKYTVAVNNAGRNKMDAACRYIRISGVSPEAVANVIITVNEEII